MQSVFESGVLVDESCFNLLLNLELTLTHSAFELPLKIFSVTMLLSARRIRKRRPANEIVLSRLKFASATVLSSGRFDFVFFFDESVDGAENT